MEFSSTRPVGTKRNETIIFILPISHPFPTYFGLKWTIIVFLLFFEFFIIFMEFSITLWVRTKRNDNFYFRYFLAFSILFWVIKPHRYFLIFWIFLPFFWNFLSLLGQECNGSIIFIFTISQSFPTYFCLKWSRDGIF